MTSNTVHSAPALTTVALPVPAADGPAQTMHLRLHLQRTHPGAQWSAELAVPGTVGRLTFPTLDALARWLARLDRPPEGLR